MGSALNYPSSSVFLPYKGLRLYITVVEYQELMYTPYQKRLKELSDTMQMSPYVCLEYADSKLRTNNCTDGNNSHVFNDEFEIRLVEGQLEINVSVWNRNTISGDDLIGRGWISLEEILSQDYNDSFWALQCKSGRYAGEVRLIMEVSSKRAISLRVPPMIEAGASSELFKPVFREAITPAAPSPTSTMFIPIKCFLLQVTVMGCYKLRNTKQMSPYVCIEYANSVFRTENGRDGTVIQLFEGVVEMVVSVRSSNTEGEKLIGIGRILLEEVLSQGYDDSLWALHCGNGRFAGVIQLKMQLSHENAHSLGVLETPDAEALNEPFEPFELFEVEFSKSITPAAVPYHTPASPSIPAAPPYAPDYPQKHGSFDNEEMKKHRLSDFEVVSEHLLSNCQEMEERRLFDFDVVSEEHKLFDYEGMEEHKLFDYEGMEEHILFDYEEVWERY